MLNLFTSEGFNIGSISFNWFLTFFISFCRAPARVIIVSVESFSFSLILESTSDHFFLSKFFWIAVAVFKSNFRIIAILLFAILINRQCNKGYGKIMKISRRFQISQRVHRILLQEININTRAISHTIVNDYRSVTYKYVHHIRVCDLRTQSTQAKCGFLVRLFFAFFALIEIRKVQSPLLLMIRYSLSPLPAILRKRNLKTLFKRWRPPIFSVPI